MSRGRRGWIRGLYATLMVLLMVWIVGEAEEGGEYVIDHFSGEKESSGLPKGWRPLHFEKIPRHTDYTLQEEGGDFFVKAVSTNSASGIYKEVNRDPREHPIISWRWRVENLLEKGDALRKSGDDYPARIYVTFKYDPEKAGFFERFQYEAVRLLYGEYPPKGAINYIWDNRLRVGTVLKNAYTDWAKMIVVESGPLHVGQWVSEERNLYEDYKNLFGEEPPLILAVSLMTDTDNTGESATAYYDDLVLKRRR